MEIRKRNGKLVPYDIDKIILAITRANEAAEQKQLTEEQIRDIAEYVTFKWERSGETPDVETTQNWIQDQLISHGAPNVAINYAVYRDRHAQARHLKPSEIEDNAVALQDLMIRKKNGTVQPYSREKLLKAVGMSANRARLTHCLTEEEANRFSALVEDDLAKLDKKVVPTSDLHILVEKNLKYVAPDVAETYCSYHSFRMGQAKMWDALIVKSMKLFEDSSMLKGEAKRQLEEQLQQNANADSTLASTKANFMANYLGEGLFHYQFQTAEEEQIADDGYLYFHDKGARMEYPLNCCLFRMDHVLENGCEVNGLWYNRPTTLQKAFSVMSDFILMAASQQYGGFTVPRVDSVVAPYAEMSFKKYTEKYLSRGMSQEDAEAQAYEDVKIDMYDGFQGLEFKCNTVASSRGDYPFTTFTLGLDQSRFGRMAAIACLDTRCGGQGLKGKKKPVLFPKLVFLYDENLHGKGKPLEDVFEAGIHCSSKAMYPDWLSLTGEGYVSSMYKKYGAVISPMGCRAFLSPWYERGGMSPADENDKPVFEGRFNLGVISLNLPMILRKSQKENTDFYETLDYYLNVIRNHHKRTYEYLSHFKASCNPMGFMYGGFYGGNLKAWEEVAPTLKAATMSFGVTALNEVQRLYNGKSIYEDGQFALDVMKHINDKLNEFKEEDHILYAVYGTPAEHLSGRQVEQFRSKYGVIENVSDRTYVSNSFHCHVTEDITPIQKQDAEKRFWNYFNGGKIQYCRYPLGYNVESIRTLVHRAMKFGFYEGVNMSLDYCDDCGYQQVDMGDECPKCGSHRITSIDRMNGYLGFTRKGTQTYKIVEEDGSVREVFTSAYSPHMQDNIKDRISM